MHKFKIAKLVRDKIAKKMITSENAGYRVLNNKEYIEELKKKVFEESKELIPETDKKKIVKELADIQDIIDALIRALKSSKQKLKEKQREENKKSGAFKKRLYIKTIEPEDNHEWLDYYLANPDKYSRIRK